jgi:hypothetical protein
MKASSPIAVLRMDIEGHEVTVLNRIVDAAADLRRAARLPAYIVFEPHAWEYHDSNDLSSALRRLRGIGYEIEFLGCRDERTSPMRARGYSALERLQEPSRTRGVYGGIPQDEAVELASRIEGVTTVCLTLRVRDASFANPN